MNKYTVKIANRIIEIETVHVLPMALSRIYLYDGVPEIRIKSTQKDIDRAKAEYERLHGITCSWDGNVEVMVVLRKLAEVIPEYGAFIMHGAAVGYNNNAYIFSGNSGVGKTTHILKWLKNLPGSMVINGDKPFILADEIPLVCGSPWAGKESMHNNIIMPMKAVVFLERAEYNHIHQLSFSEAFPFLYQQIYRTPDANVMRKTLGLIRSLDHKVAFYRFEINNFKDDCFDVAYNALV